jgi:hypothetical protein
METTGRKHRQQAMNTTGWNQSATDNGDNRQETTGRKQQAMETLEPWEMMI